MLPQEGENMEYDFYMEQKYLYEARTLTAAWAEALGYEDGYAGAIADHKPFADGFISVMG